MPFIECAQRASQLFIDKISQQLNINSVGHLSRLSTSLPLSSLPSFAFHLFYSSNETVILPFLFILYTHCSRCQYLHIDEYSILMSCESTSRMFTVCSIFISVLEQFCQSRYVQTDRIVRQEMANVTGYALFMSDSQFLQLVWVFSCTNLLV